MDLFLRIASPQNACSGAKCNLSSRGSWVAWATNRQSVMNKTVPPWGKICASDKIPGGGCLLIRAGSEAHDLGRKLLTSCAGQVLIPERSRRNFLQEGAELVPGIRRRVVLSEQTVSLSSFPALGSVSFVPGCVQHLPQTGPGLEQAGKQLWGAVLPWRFGFSCALCSRCALHVLPLCWNRFPGQ